jgi:hypothetical protein
VGPFTLNDKLVARGKVAMISGAPDSGMLMGWFNSKSVDQKDGLREFVGVRVEGPTRVGHYFAPVVADERGVGGKVRAAPVLTPDGKSHDWEIEYDPKGNGGGGEMVVRLDGETVRLDLKLRGPREGRLDRFGVFTPRVGGSQVKIYFDDVNYTATRD